MEDERSEGARAAISARVGTADVRQPEEALPSQDGQALERA